MFAMLVCLIAMFVFLNWWNVEASFDGRGGIGAGFDVVVRRVLRYDGAAGYEYSGLAKLRGYTRSQWGRPLGTRVNQSLRQGVSRKTRMRSVSPRS